MLPFSFFNVFNLINLTPEKYKEIPKHSMNFVNYVIQG